LESQSWRRGWFSYFQPGLRDPCPGDTLDLFDYGTYRGADGPPPRPPLNLSRNLVQVHIILPRFSETGAYMISIAGDRNGKGRLACVSGIASQSGNKTSLDVTLTCAAPGQENISSLPS
jgi:hypothetical protein